MIFSCLITLLALLLVHGRSLSGNNANDNDLIIETSIGRTLPRGMNSEAYDQSILNYWTPERMAAAQPMDILMVMANSSSFNTTNDARLRTNDDKTLSQSSVPGVPPRFLRASSSTIGKVYGKMGGGGFVCSASVIVSDNRDTLLTAGHCVWDSDRKTWASDIVFVPQYSRGSRPLGTWVWRKVGAMNGWTQNRNFDYDVAVVLVSATGEGKHVQDYTGALGMTKNWGRQAWTDAYGYPMNMHNGEVMSTCSAESKPAAISDYGGSELSCAMGGGSSGGPWTQRNDYQTSVNSFGISNRPNVMFGPYFGDAVWNLWEQFKK
jgi:V8-like Glu-specific endopeptidase